MSDITDMYSLQQLAIVDESNNNSTQFLTATFHLTGGMALAAIPTRPIWCRRTALGGEEEYYNVLPQKQLRPTQTFSEIQSICAVYIHFIEINAQRQKLQTQQTSKPS